MSQETKTEKLGLFSSSPPESLSKPLVLYMIIIMGAFKSEALGVGPKPWHF